MNIFTKHIGFSWLGLQQIARGMDFQWQPEVWNMLGLSGAYGIGISVVGLMLFVRQDLNHST